MRILWWIALVLMALWSISQRDVIALIVVVFFALVTVIKSDRR